jgi:hypothetical protein
MSAAAQQAEDRKRKARMKEALALVKAYRAENGVDTEVPAANDESPKRQALRKIPGLRDEFVRLSTGGRWHDAASKEWAGVSRDHRVFIMLLAGMDGDLDVLAGRAWREFTPPEREAISAQIRSTRRAFSAVTAICSRAQ